VDLSIELQILSFHEQRKAAMSRLRSTAPLADLVEAVER
jgi:hypothetical protein